jgi:RNase H-like domain found in reverse transcriptase
MPKSFLGLAQQLGGFMVEITGLMEPLRDLNKNRTDWVWLPQHQATFEEACRCLSGPSHLTFFDPSHATELLTDASKIHSLGFLLRQRCEDGQWRTVQQLNGFSPM